MTSRENHILTGLLDTLHLQSVVFINSCAWLPDTCPGDMVVRMHMVMATPLGWCNVSQLVLQVFFCVHNDRCSNLYFLITLFPRFIFHVLLEIWLSKTFSFLIIAILLAILLDKLECFVGISTNEKKCIATSKKLQ